LVRRARLLDRVRRWDGALRESEPDRVDATLEARTKIEHIQCREILAQRVGVAVQALKQKLAPGRQDVLHQPNRLGLFFRNRGEIE